jgi:NADH-quinone oxidoreductase subunit J
MTADQIVFLATAAITLGAALMVVTTRDLVHAALWLILTLFGVAVFFVMLNAGFLAVAQVVIYIGAIAILMIFAVMMTRRVVREFGRQFNAAWPLSVLVAAALFAGLAWLNTSWEGFNIRAAPPLAEGADPLVELGAALVSPNMFILPFELASILLLAALIGALIIAWERTA